MFSFAKFQGNLISNYSEVIPTLVPVPSPGTTYYLPSVRISEENCEVRRLKSGYYMSAVDPDSPLVSVQKPVEISLSFLY